MTSDHSENHIVAKRYELPQTAPTDPRVRRGRLAVVMSFFVLSTLGVALIVNYWAHLSVGIGIARSIVFVVFMGSLHVYVFHSWKRQQETNTPETVVPTFWTREVRHGMLYLLGFVLACILLRALML